MMSFYSHVTIVQSVSNWGMRMQSSEGIGALQGRSTDFLIISPLFTCNQNTAQFRQDPRDVVCVCVRGCVLVWACLYVCACVHTVCAYVRVVFALVGCVCACAYPVFAWDCACNVYCVFVYVCVCVPVCVRMYSVYIPILDTVEKELVMWKSCFDSNTLTLNLSKCIIKSKIKINDVEIERVSEITFIGVIIDNEVNCNTI